MHGEHKGTKRAEVSKLARYVKEVDAREMTVRFYQEIYNETGQLVEVHDKYPVDLGHRKV